MNFFFLILYNRFTFFLSQSHHHPPHTYTINIINPTQFTISSNPWKTSSFTSFALKTGKESIIIYILQIKKPEAQRYRTDQKLLKNRDKNLTYLLSSKAAYLSVSRSTAPLAKNLCDGGQVILRIRHIWETLKAAISVKR